MRKICYNSVCLGFSAFINKIAATFILTAVLACFPLLVSAYTIDLEVAGGKGGKIVSTGLNSACSLDCKLETHSKKFVSLLAVPDKGFRFLGWEGACADNLGPLCSLKAKQNDKVGAQFAKTNVQTLPTRALLLLHDEADKQTVWNEFVKQRFKNHCPTIYGGVLLDTDATDNNRQTHCYRIAFGYYELLARGLGKDVSRSQETRQPTKIRIHSQYLGYEIRAAVLAILNRHPNLSLTLVGQSKSLTAAQSFLHQDADSRQFITGLLALVPPISPNNLNKIHARSLIEPDDNGVASLKLAANPREVDKIGAALEDLAKPNRTIRW